MKKTRNAVLSSVLGLVLAMVAGGAGSAAASPTDLPLDPIVSEVVEMLNAGVSDSLILQWLESTDRRPVDIGSLDLIALTDAEASEELIAALLNRVEEARTAEPIDSSGAPPEPTPVAPLAASVRDSRTTVPVDGSVEATFRLSAKRVWVDEEEPDSPREPRWNVFLYLDGEVIVWTRPDAKGKPVEARRSIAAGHREMRVVLQRYEERREGWRYESLSVPTLVAFEVQPGDPVEIEVDMKRIWGLWRNRKDGGPLSYVVRQGGEVLVEQSGTGGNPERWQPVCEDVEANFPDAEGVPKAFRNPMSRCVRWAELWNGPGKSTSRPGILEELAEYDFEPPVR